MAALGNFRHLARAVNRHPPFGLLYALIAGNELVARWRAQTRYIRHRVQNGLTATAGWRGGPEVESIQVFIFSAARATIGASRSFRAVYSRYHQPRSQSPQERFDYYHPAARQLGNPDEARRAQGTSGSPKATRHIVLCTAKPVCYTGSIAHPSSLVIGAWSLVISPLPAIT